MQFPLGDTKDPQTCVLHALLPQLSVLQAQPSCHLPPIFLLVVKAPSCAPPNSPVLHRHIQTLLCLGMDSTLLHVWQSLSKIHSQVVWQKNERALLSPPRAPSTGRTGCAGRAVRGPVPPCEVAGELCGMEVPLHSGSRQARLGEALAGRIQPNQSRLSPPHRAQSPALVPGAPRVPRGACRTPGPQRYGGGRNLRTAVMNSSNLS